MAILNKFNIFTTDGWLAKHQLNTDQVNVYLTNVQPVVGNTVKANIAEIAAGNGYPANGYDTENVQAQDSPGQGTVTTVASITVTAASGPIAQFQWIVAYNLTAAGGPLIGWYEIPAPVDLLDTQSFIMTFPAVWLTNV